MTNKAFVFNGYSSYGKHFDGNSSGEGLDQHSIPFSSNRRAAEVSQLFSSAGSAMSDEYFSSSDLMSGETLWEPEFQNNGTQYSRQIRSGIDWNPAYYPEDVDYLAAPASCQGVKVQRNGIPEKFQEHFVNDLPQEFIPDDRRRFMVPKHQDIWSIPPSPIFQSSPSSVEDMLPGFQAIFTNPKKMRAQDCQKNGSELVTKTFDESADGSFLFVTTNNVEKLKVVLRERGLEVQDIGRTSTVDVLVVLFKKHEFAKRAFTIQKEIGIRMVPPSPTKRYWLKNPSPKFHVIFETTRRLTVKNGKSNSNMKVGDFLMTNARSGKGCLVLADQMKGHRLRVVSYVGKFMRTDGIIIKQNCMIERKTVGWISTQCHKTKEKFVLRRSMNEIKDYVYDDVMRAVE